MTEKWCNSKYVTVNKCSCGLNIDLIIAGIGLYYSQRDFIIAFAVWISQSGDTEVIQMTVAVDNKQIHLLDMQLNTFSNICLSSAATGTYTENLHLFLTNATY